MDVKIAKEVFEKFPGYRRGLVIAYEIDNSRTAPDLIKELREAEEHLRKSLKPETFISEPKISVWREAYRAIGIKPGDFRPSMDALVRRVLKNDPLPSINPVVDLGNLESIRHIVPIGAHAIDVLKGDMELRLASGSEIFEAFGSEISENPNPGEIIFVEGKTVLTRRWTWRQAKHTLVLPSSSAVEFNIDAMSIVSDAEVEEICEDIGRLVIRNCGGKIKTGILSQSEPSLSM